MARLMTADQVATEYGLPSSRTVRTMRARGLPAVRLGKAYLYAASDVEQYIDNAKVQLCPVPTREPRSSGLLSGDASTLYGTKEAGSVSVLLARQTAGRLKKLSPSFSASDDATSDPIGHGSRRS